MNRKLRKALEEQGATVEHRSAGHLKVSKPGHEPVFCSSTPGGGRGDRNMLATLRRLGYLPKSWRLRG